METIIDIIVKIIAIYPIFCVSGLPFLMYFIPGKSPSGGRKMLKSIIPIILGIDILRGISLIRYPQVGQKLKDSCTKFLHFGQIFPMNKASHR
jgi:hypothetical protein